jgi:5-methylcytosine-specific restriction endonuclease McrA
MRNGGAWTDSRYKSFVVSALRAAFRRWPPKFNVLKKAATERRINPKSGKLAMHYTCAECRKDYPAKEVQVDHKKPVVDPKKGFVDWNTFIERLYIEARGLQVMCKPCHKDKSKKERAQRNAKKQVQNTNS